MKIVWFTLKSRRKLLLIVTIRFEKKISSHISTAVLKHNSLTSLSFLRSGPRVLECVLCSRSFTGPKRTRNMRCHIEGVHLKLKNHACEFCGKTFSQNTNRKRHSKICRMRDPDIDIIKNINFVLHKD